MSDKINSFCSLSTEEAYANNQWWMLVYTLEEDGYERDYHNLEFSGYDAMIRFKRMLQNTQTPVEERDTIFVGAYGPIIETEEN